MGYQTKTDLILPFKGEWIVANGGRSHETNGHINVNDAGPAEQRFAYDFIRPHKGTGGKLEDYKAFGSDVVAPGNGVIAKVVNGTTDIQIGERDRTVLYGNHIVIDHQNGEWSVLCHFKYNSIKIKVGDKVKQDDILGLCGNTGNTSEPHVHYHLQDKLESHKAEGLPIQFRRIKVNGEIKENYEPVRGQVVENP